MLTHAQIETLVPHKGAMCLLDGLAEWSSQAILCVSRSHLDTGNPLRRNGRLGMLCGCEYGFQAAALHGALLAGNVPQLPGYLAALRVTHRSQDFLDDPALGELRIAATLQAASPEGLVYAFSLASEAGAMLLQGRGTIRLPAA